MIRIILITVCFQLLTLSNLEAQSQKKLTKYVLNEKKDHLSRLNTLLKIYEQEYVIEIIKSCNDTKIRYNAICYQLKEDKHQDLLIDIVYNDPDDKLRGSILQFINDPNELSKLVKTEKNDEVRSKAVSRVKDKELIRDLAINDPNQNIRSQAIYKLDDKNWDLFRKALENDTSSLVRLAAYDQLVQYGHKEYASGLAKNDPYDEIRKAAIKHLNDDELRHLVLNDQSYMVRLEALVQMKCKGEKEFYEKIRTTEKSGKLKEQAEECLVVIDKIDEAKSENSQKELNRIALDRNYPVRARVEAIKKITDRDVLLKIIKHPMQASDTEEAYFRLEIIDNDPKTEY
ncbi:HEAT repeat domain-containing protein [Bacteroidota bacterium]